MFIRPNKLKRIALTRSDFTTIFANQNRLIKCHLSSEILYPSPLSLRGQFNIFCPEVGTEHAQKQVQKGSLPESRPPVNLELPRDDSHTLLRGWMEPWWKQWEEDICLSYNRSQKQMSFKREMRCWRMGRETHKSWDLSGSSAAQLACQGGIRNSSPSSPPS